MLRQIRVKSSFLTQRRTTTSRLLITPDPNSYNNCKDGRNSGTADYEDANLVQRAKYQHQGSRSHDQDAARWRNS